MVLITSFNVINSDNHNRKEIKIFKNGNQLLYTTPSILGPHPNSTDISIFDILDFNDQVIEFCEKKTMYSLGKFIFITSLCNVNDRILHKTEVQLKIYNERYSFIEHAACGKSIVSKMQRVTKLLLTDEF